MLPPSWTVVTSYATDRPVDATRMSVSITPVHSAPKRRRGRPSPPAAGLSIAVFTMSGNLTFQRRNDLHGAAQRLQTVMGIFHHLVGAAVTGRRLELELRGHTSAGLNRDLLLDHRPGLWMPGDESILAWRDIGDRERPVLARERVIRMCHRHAPAYHVGMKPTLHDEDPAPLGHVDRLRHRLAGEMLMGMGGDIPLVVGVHRKWGVEQHARTELRGLIRLDIVHHRVHVDHDDLVIIP